MLKKLLALVSNLSISSSFRTLRAYASDLYFYFIPQAALTFQYSAKPMHANTEPSTLSYRLSLYPENFDGYPLDIHLNSEGVSGLHPSIALPVFEHIYQSLHSFPSPQPLIHNVNLGTLEKISFFHTPTLRDLACNAKTVPGKSPSVTIPQQASKGADGYLVSSKCIQSSLQFALNFFGLLELYALPDNTSKRGFSSYFKSTTPNRFPIPALEDRYGNFWIAGFHATRNNQINDLSQGGLMHHYAKDGLYGKGVYTSPSLGKSLYYRNSTAPELLFVLTNLGQCPKFYSAKEYPRVKIEDHACTSLVIYPDAEITNSRNSSDDSENKWEVVTKEDGSQLVLLGFEYSMQTKKACLEARSRCRNQTRNAKPPSLFSGVAYTQELQCHVQ